MYPCLHGSSPSYITINIAVPHFNNLSALNGCWSSVSVRRSIYNILNTCPFECTAVLVSGKVGARKSVLPHQWGGVVYPSDRPKSVRNRCVIEVLVAFLCCHIVFGLFCGYRGFFHRTESNLFLFLFGSQMTVIIIIIIFIQELGTLLHKIRHDNKNKAQHLRHLSQN